MAYQLSNTRITRARKVTWVGIIVNIILAVLKFTAGTIGRSSAMVADAVHSISDLITDLVVLLGLKFVGTPADSGHDYGHGKFETLSTAVIGMILCVIGAGMFWDGIVKIVLAGYGSKIDRPAWLVCYIAGFSLAAKEWLYRYTVNNGKRINSQAVIANAWHHRSDAFSSFGVMIGICGAIVLGEKWRILDPLAAVIVSAVIIKVGGSIFMRDMNDLLEGSINQEKKAVIFRIISDTQGVINPHNLKTRMIGSNIAVDIHIRVDRKLNIVQAHNIATLVEERIKQTFGQESFVSVHMEPAEK